MGAPMLIPSLLMSLCQSDELATPFQLHIAGALHQVPLGHLAPRFWDWDGDGLEDLLLGQFEGGRLAIHRNIGRRGRPRFAPAVWFEAGGGPGTIPAG
jgi:hypothetical protein